MDTYASGIQQSRNVDMYGGQQGGSVSQTHDILDLAVRLSPTYFESLLVSDNSGRSPSDSIELSPTEVSRPMEMEHLTKSHLPFDSIAGEACARRLNNFPAPWSLESFYANDEQPWSGFKLPASASLPGNVINPVEGRRNASAFGSWRSTGAASSECGTVSLRYLPSDSGYESRAKQSIDGRSVYDDSQDIQSLSGHMLDLNPFQLNTPGFARDTPAQPWYPAATVPVKNGNADKQLVCPHCNALCKTKSELNKHHQRHLKAHKCEVPGCSRKEGFGTLNDLDRHTISVHPELPASGPRYRCNIGQCQTRDKIWPRTDNFRQHLKRVHDKSLLTDDDLRDFLYHHQQSPKPTDALRTVQEDLEGVGLDFLDFNTDPLAEGLDSPQQPMDMDDLILDPDLANAEGSLVQTEYVQPKDISRSAPLLKAISMSHTEPRGSQTAQPRVTVDLTNRLETPTSPQEFRKANVTDDLDCEHSKASPPDNSGTIETSREKPVSQELFLSIDSLNEQDALKLLERFPHLLEKIMKSNTAPSTAQKAPPPHSTIAQSRHHCSHVGCGKNFARKCELKKHMKRHDKPYGCTFAGCNKKFGSKNDWKRHENSQHFHLEIWKCDERCTATSTAAAADNAEGSMTASLSAESCSKVCNRRESFQTHLKKDHKIETPKEIKATIKTCHADRNHNSRFWCGFCVKAVEIQTGANAWTERFNHIDDHYAGRDNAPKKDISEWKNFDTELPEMNLPGSVDDSGDAESADEAAVVPRQTAELSRKRGAEDVDDGEGGPKRPRNDTRVTLMWSCCFCAKDAPANLHDTCVNCLHQRCRNCGEHEVTTR